MSQPTAPAVIPHVEVIPLDAPVGASFWLVGKSIDIVAPGETFSPCGRCGGRGFIEAYGHVYEGVCFDCNRTKGTRSTIAHENKLARARTKAAAKRAAKEAERRETRQAAIAKLREHPGVATALAWYEGHNRKLHEVDTDRTASYAPFMHDTGLGRAQAFVSDIFRYDGDIPAWKIEAITEAVEQFIGRAYAAMAEAEHFAASPAPLGKGIEVEGEVVSQSVQESEFNGRPVSTYKMLVVTDAGWKVFITEPRSIDPQKGDRVAFTCELVEGRDGDPQFRIGKRPTRARITKSVPEVG